VSEQNPVCRRCGETVVVNKAKYEIFEGMHWICFHLEYERECHDRDEVYDDPECFWRYSQTVLRPDSGAGQ